MQISSDQQLIAGILSKDKRDVARFYHIYAPKLSRHIARKVSNTKDAEEILQDTLFHFLESLRDFEGKSSMQTFLYSICNHKIIDYYRKKKFKHMVFSQLPQLEALVSELHTPETELDSVFLKDQITRAFATLIPQYRNVLQSKYIEGLPIEEIAEQLEVTAKSVESMLFRARQAFVKAFISI